MESEIWKEYNGRYLVSNFGNVDILNYRHTGKRKRMILIKDKYGYLVLGIIIDGKRKRFYVHRLVALCFIPNPNNYEQVNHINAVKTDNNVSNLEWCTHQMNHDHAKRLGLKAKGEKHGRCKFTDIEVADMRKLDKDKIMSRNEIQKKYSISQSALCKIVNYKSRKHITKNPIEINQLGLCKLLIYNELGSCVHDNKC